MTEITRHFTATTFVVHGGAVLLHLHPKQKLWLPPGGHIERDEMPHVAAIREIDEETGLRVRLHSEEEAVRLSEQMGCLVVPQPAFILVEDINPFHQHIDFTYFAQVENAKSIASEEHQFQWISPNEMEMEGVPENVKEGARRAIAHFEANPESR